MQHNPQYRPPNGPRALPGLAAVARVWAAAGQRSGPHTHTLVRAAPDGPRRQPSKADPRRRRGSGFSSQPSETRASASWVERPSTGSRFHGLPKAFVSVPCTDGGTTGTAEDEHRRRVHPHQPARTPTSARALERCRTWRRWR